MKEYSFTISENALVNLIHNYANNKLRCENAQYTDELWMNTLGISPNSYFVTKIVEEEEKRMKRH